MRRPISRWLAWGGVGLAAILAVIVQGSGVLNQSIGVGHADIDVALIVRDAATGEPIEGATLLIVNDHVGSPDCCGMVNDSTLTTDAAGIARARCHDALSTDRRDIFRTRYGIGDPSWMVRASAPGYETTPILDVSPSSRLVPHFAERVAPSQWRFTAEISLQKALGRRR